MSKPKTKAPILTLAEDKYLRHLAASKTPIAIKLHTQEVLRGELEIFDAQMLRISQPGSHSLFLYKKDVKYLWEEKQ
ncbi:hypothetical protein [Bryobacter aggregatus]|uniref:hypothetical protein n=1 Tax=Bryobacter aggregatus TaxID=360054 RepID=UPI0004E275D8|nr:hypothetical protein [Bryobacter aggregatus]